MLFKEKEPGTGSDRESSDKEEPQLYPGLTPEELRAALAFAEKKLQLVGSVTRHDVLNQLTAIVGYNELLGMMIEDPKLKTYLERERHAVDKIRRQFQFAKDYQNIGAAPFAWLPLRQLIHQAGEEADLRPIQILDETGPASVFADPQFVKVIIQILDNTRRHGIRATRIRIFLQDGPAGGTQLIFEDDGEGIPAGDKTKIFERGFGKGTGWGLFLAREILEFCGMSIRESGEPGKGARLVITLPEEKIRKNG
ncbi:HAMP domain-containing sensor histidine kinase [uncultured Methanoregula sp.]|uniref:sensor histidine kinase n=1 Tax=uncultured Methanoregula sp. TaxID=1005933 RepID=UPI002AAACADE|nr:HAMP domain-containing sensor histidine kinase [uncultured Methanoregula sp.]